MMVCLCVGQTYAADVKVGVLDIDKIISDSKAGKSASVIFNKEKETKQAALNAKGKEVQTIQDEINSKAKDMTAAAYTEKTAKYSKLKKEYDRMKTEIDEDLKDRNTELTRRLYSEVAAIVSDYCKKEKYTVILEKSYVAAYDGAIDITDKIVQLYDASKDVTTNTTGTTK